jgi:hypothetical protein
MGKQITEVSSIYTQRESSEVNIHQDISYASNITRDHWNVEGWLKEQIS